MKTFLEFLHEQDQLDEKLMTFGGKAYPKFGNVVILAGGAGSGKGFQGSRLLGIEGKTLDVDKLKELAIKSTKFSQRVKDETGYELSKFDLRVPENVSTVHEILSDVYGVTKAHDKILFSSILLSDPDRKPNLIFDVTLKDLSKLESISRNVSRLGYEKTNIHIVWVVNDINIAIQQNKSRSRVVQDEILMATHEGAALTMKKILNMRQDLKKYMDGDIYISFNKVGVDANLKKSDFGGSYVSDANYFKVKTVGKPQLDSDKLDKEIQSKIASYVPDTDTWKK